MMPTTASPRVNALTARRAGRAGQYRHTLAALPVRLLSLLLFTCFVLLQAGCADNTPEPTFTIKIALLTTASPSTSAATKSTTNLISTLDGQWRGWTTGDSPVSFDALSGELRIPGASQGEDMVIGVRHYNDALSAGVAHTLHVQSSNPHAAAIIFLQLDNGQIVPAALDANGALELATQDRPVTFYPPVGVVGFYLQVQNQWRPDATVSLAADLVTGQTSPGTLTGNDELIVLPGQWLNWDGQPDGVSYDPASQRLVISPPAHLGPYSIGTRVFATPLAAGTSYALRLAQSSDPQASVLLFLLNQDRALIPFNNPAPWLSASGDHVARFTAPAGVAYFAIQVQSRAGASTDSFVQPSLRVSAEVPGSSDGESDDGFGGDNPDPGNDNSDGNDQNAGGGSEGNGGNGNNGDLGQGPGDPVAAQRDAFQQALIARRGFECQATGDPNFPSFRWVDTYTADYLVADGYAYMSGDCSGIPYSPYLPLNLRRYAIGGLLALPDGRSAWAIDFEVLLPGEIDGQPADAPAGAQRYDIVNLVDDDTFYSASGEADDPAQRPHDLDNGEPGFVVRIEPWGNPALAPADIAGQWVRECGDAGGSTTRSVFTYGTDLSTVRVTGYTDTSCTTSYFSYEIDRTISYGQTTPGALGDYLMPVTTTVTRAEFSNRASGDNLPPLPTLPDVGSTHYGAVSLIDNTLMFGECLFYTPCARSDASRTDIIDFYSGKRLIRLQSAIQHAGQR